MILVASAVAAAAPTTPTTYTANNSIFFNYPTLTCSGSTDADTDTIYYEFYSPCPEGGGGVVEYTLETNEVGGTATDTTGLGNWINVTQNVYLTGVERMGSNFTMCNLTTMEVGDLAYWEFSYDGGAGDPAPTAGWETLTPSYQITPGGYNYTLKCGMKIGHESYLYAEEAIPAVGDFPYGDANNILNITYGAAGASTSMVSNRLYNWKSIKYEVGGLGNLIQNSTSSTTTNVSMPDAGDLNWSCRAYANGDVSSFTDNLTIFYMNFTYCPSDDTDAALNFTIRDEETSALLDNVSFDASLTLSSAIDSLTYGFELIGSDNYTLCLFPNNIYVNVTGFIDYDSNDSDYSYPRQYYFDTAEIIGNAVQNINLYQLADSLATAVTFTVIRGVSVVSDIIIHLQRYNPGTGEYNLVAMAKTNSEGKDIIYLRLTDAWYRIFAYEDNVLVYSNDAEHITSTTKTIYLSTGGDTMTNYWTQWEHFGNIVYNMSWDNATQWAAVTYDDSTGAASTACLIVDKILWNETENVCYNCTSAASATLGCKILDDNNQYYARFIVYQNPWRVLDELWIDIRTKAIDIIGQGEGMFYTILIVGILTFMAVWNPTTAIVLAVAGTGFMYAFGFLDVAYGFMISLAIAAALLIMRLKT